MLLHTSPAWGQMYLLHWPHRHLFLVEVKVGSYGLSSGNSVLCTKAMSTIKFSMWAWRDMSIGKSTFWQVWRPEFKSSSVHPKARHSCTPRQEACWFLLAASLAPGSWETLLQGQIRESWNRTSNIPPLSSVCLGSSWVIRLIFCEISHHKLVSWFLLFRNSWCAISWTNSKYEV